MIGILMCVAMLAQEVPETQPVVPPAATATPVAAPGETAAPAPTAPVLTPEKAIPTDPKLALDEVLERAGIEAVNALEREVKSLQQTLDGLVLADGESNVKILGAKGAEDDLESFGVDDAVARQVRRLLDEVRSKRARLALLDLRGASNTAQKDPLRSATEVAADPEPALPAPTVAVTGAADATVNVLAGPSPDAQRECAIAYRDRDVKTVLTLLADVPLVRMKAETQWIYATCLMSERRFTDAKTVFTQLQNDTDHAHLADSAKQQLKRIEFLENGLVGQGPTLETKK